MNRTGLVVLVGALGACSPAAPSPVAGHATALAPLSPPAPAAEDATQRSDAFDGWFVSGSGPSHYRVERDAVMKHGGNASARISAVNDPGDQFCTLMQTVAANDYAGKRVRLSAFVRSGELAKWSGLWMRVDRENGQMGAFDNMQTRPIRGTTEWMRHEVVLDIAPDAKTLNFGVLQHGHGTTWIDDVTLEVVGTSVPTTDTGGGGANPTPKNLGFDE